MTTITTPAISTPSPGPPGGATHPAPDTGSVQGRKTTPLRVRDRTPQVGDWIKTGNCGKPRRVTCVGENMSYCGKLHVIKLWAALGVYDMYLNTQLSKWIYHSRKDGGKIMK